MKHLNCIFICIFANYYKNLNLILSSVGFVAACFGYQKSNLHQQSIKNLRMTYNLILIRAKTF